MRATKTTSGLVLPESADPQGYGKVVSVGELIDNIKDGDYLVFHPRAGMDIVMNKTILKVLKYDELYGILQDDEIKDTLEVMKIGGGDQAASKIIQPATNIIQ